MKSKLIPEIAFSLISILLVTLLVNPFGIIMPSQIEMIVIALTAIAFSAFLIFLWGEKPRDEREEYNLYLAGRFSFYSVAVVLLVGTIYQALNHELDAWLIISLLVLVLSKVFALAYQNNQN